MTKEKTSNWIYKPTHQAILWEAFFSVCIFATAINDHYLKETYGNFWTGKISDLFGPFVMFRLLIGIGKVGLPSKISAIVTCIFCVSIKVSQTFADLVSHLSCLLTPFQGYSCRVIADPLDLVAMLPFIVFAIGVIRKPHSFRFHV